MFVKVVSITFPSCQSEARYALRQESISTTLEQTGLNLITHLPGYPPSCKLLTYAYWRQKFTPLLPKLSYQLQKVAEVTTKKRS
jgi:hypothetical protein